MLVKTSVFECKDCLGYRNTAIYRENGEICVSSWSVGAFICIDTGRMVRLPESIINTLTFDDKLDMNYLDRRIVLPKEGFVEKPKITVKPFDIDINDHVNNVKYIKIAIEAIEEGCKFDRIRVEYKVAAKLDDIICPNVYDFDPERVYVKLNNEAGKPYSLLEFSNRRM